MAGGQPYAGLFWCAIPPLLVGDGPRLTADWSATPVRLRHDDDCKTANR